MTDITELALRLKLEAHRAVSNFNPQMNIKTRDLMALVEALEYYKSREERVTSLVRDNSKSWDELYRQVEAKGKRNVELVEALEKAQRANAAQDDHINQQQDRIDQLGKGHQEAAKQINSWRRMAKQNIAEREKDIAELDADRQRIAELESRTVKLPKLKMLEDYLAEVAIEERKQILVGVKLEFHRACVAAGIKVEAE